MRRVRLCNSWFDLKGSGEGFCRTGKGQSFNIEGPKTEKARGPTAESLEQESGG